MAEQTPSNSAPTTPDAGGQGGQPPAAPQGAPGKTFTQEQLDAIIADRLQRERDKYKDYDTLKQAAQAAEDAKKSELEKATDRVSKAEARAKEVEAQTTARLLQSEARAIASEIGFTKPAAAVKLADLSKAVKDGEIDAGAIKTALEVLAAEMPELLGKTTPKVPATNPQKGSGTGDKKTDAQLLGNLRGGGGFDAWSRSGNVIITSKGEKT